ncbi:MAG: antibiotic ABC transporter ATP-binding protein [Planctomycetes bacterium B3_Pla]|nr:MAG: antibiotic ABC transporter ATP-binding protein [Planctomycetes bacterium B3_Pla]
MTEGKKKPPKSGLARRLLAYSPPYWRWMLLSLILILTLSAMINFLPVLIKRITDSCLLNNEVAADDRLKELTQLSWLYLMLAAGGHLIRYFQGLLTAWLGQRIIYDLRVDLFKKVTRLHQAYFDRMPVGALLTRVTSDIDRLERFVTDGVVGTVADVFMLVSIMVYMLLINVQVALVLFAVLPLMFGALFLINGRLREANRQIRKRQASLNALLQEDLVGMTTIQLFNRELIAQDEFMERNTDLRAAYFEEVRWFSLYFPVIEGGQAVAFLLILGAGGFLLLNNTGLISLGVLIAFLTYVRNFFRPLGSLSDKAGMFQMAMAAAERVFALIDIPEEIADPDEPLEPEKIDGNIEFSNVWFAYEDENWVLKNLSFSVRPGSVVAVVGATGAGKSTIVNLIGRFYDVQQGSVMIDSKDVRAFRRVDLRRRLGYVFQDPFIFAGTVADNISLLNPDLGSGDLIDAAKTVNAHGFISDMPNGYDTMLNERGEGLSLGQKQLLSMARTLAQNPKLLFVLDEATASVDTATEVLIQDALGKLMHNRTSIVIAHRLSTIRHADRILVMRHGELVDAGTHDQLMVRRGYYRQLYELLQRSPH